jgi:anaerobic selenocysteine-containing dehydrogenase
MGMLPPNIIPEEILSDKPDRLRAVIVCAANPLRSWADTRAFEKAFKQLELLVTIEMAMTETAAVSDYVLPAQSCFESWGGVLPCASATFPGIFFQFRQPVLKSEGEALETFEILVRLADRLGLIPPIPDSLVQSAHGDRLKFAAELTAFVKSDPALAAALPFILAKTLGKAMNSIKLAELWFNLYTAPEHIVNSLAQAGFKPGPGQVEEIFSAIVAHPEGIWAGSNNLQFNLMSLGTPDKRINLFIPEMFEWVKQIDAESESKALQIDQRYPLILSAGIHNDIVANTQLRDPAWNKGRRVCTLAMNPADAGLLKLTDGQKVQISTEVGSAEIELEVTDSVRTGQVIIPHGFGLDFNGVTQGVNINLLTRNTRRDPIAGTPWHRYVPCRVEGL